MKSDGSGLCASVEVSDVAAIDAGRGITKCVVERRVPRLGSISEPGKGSAVMANRQVGAHAHPPGCLVDSHQDTPPQREYDRHDVRSSSIDASALKDLWELKLPESRRAAVYFRVCLK